MQQQRPTETQFIKLLNMTYFSLFFLLSFYFQGGGGGGGGGGDKGEWRCRLPNCANVTKTETNSAVYGCSERPRGGPETRSSCHCSQSVVAQCLFIDRHRLHGTAWRAEKSSISPPQCLPRSNLLIHTAVRDKSSLKLCEGPIHFVVVAGTWFP